MRVPLAHLFGRSPLSEIKDLMARVAECSDKVPDLVQALIDGDQPRVREVAKGISNLEGLADQAKNRVRAHMPIRLFLPVDRRDVLRLLSEMDAIADCAEDVGVLLTIRPMEVPEEMKTLLGLFVNRVLDTVHTAAGLVQFLDSLLEASFGNRAAGQAQALIDELARKEHEADKIQDQIAKVLFGLEGTLSPVSIFMWTKILNKLGDMANHAENVGDQFRLFVAR